MFMYVNAQHTNLYVTRLTTLTYPIQHLFIMYLGLHDEALLGHEDGAAHGQDEGGCI